MRTISNSGFCISYRHLFQERSHRITYQLESESEIRCSCLNLVPDFESKTSWKENRKTSRIESITRKNWYNIVGGLKGRHLS